jgi:NAD(P)-dependent dehydrogenase (short-subunit alcohol dehydrogenase family)
MDLGRTENVVELGRRCSSVDILVNNAGEIPSGPIESLSEEDWRRGYDLKLFGYITLTRELYKVMKARGEGVIINDIGNSGENWESNYMPAAPPTPLMAFTKRSAASLDFWRTRIGVNPGPVETERMVKINAPRARLVQRRESLAGAA